MIVEIIDLSTRKKDLFKLAQTATFHDVLELYKKLNTTDAFTLNYLGKDINIYGRDTVIYQPHILRDKVQFYVMHPTPEMKDAKEFIDMERTPSLMCFIPSQTEKIVLDMSWGFAAIDRDYMDAACMIFKENKHLATVDLDNKAWSHNGREIVSYTNRGMNDRNSRGFHNIDVLVKHLPHMVTHLFMTMSAWSKEDLSDNKYPLLRCYDIKNEKSDICNTTTLTSPKSESIVLSYLSRASYGWKLKKAGHTCRGNAKNYKPVINKVKEIISSGEYSRDYSALDLVSVPPMPRNIERLPSTVGLDVAPVDIVFSFDTTGSMYSYLEEVRQRIDETITELLNEVPTLRICVLAHGDYCDEDIYITKYTDFRNNKEILCRFVNNVEPTSGGDSPECYELVLHEVRTKLTWTPKSKRCLVMIGDATPHSEHEEQNYLHLDWKKEAASLLNEKKVNIFAVQCNDHPESKIFWKELSRIGQGRHFELKNFKEIVTLLKKISKRQGALV